METTELREYLEIGYLNFHLVYFHRRSTIVLKICISVLIDGRRWERRKKKLNSLEVKYEKRVSVIHYHYHSRVRSECRVGEKNESSKNTIIIVATSLATSIIIVATPKHSRSIQNRNANDDTLMILSLFSQRILIFKARLEHCNGHPTCTNTSTR